MKKLVDELKKSLEIDETVVEEIFFAKKGFKGLKVDIKNFHSLENIGSEKTICFIDGGNAELISSNNISVQAVKIAAVIYKGSKKLKFEVKDFYTLITFKGDKFFVKTFPEEFTFELSVDDESLKEGKNVVSISKITGFVRRLAELKLAAEMVDDSNFIVLDGSLEEKFGEEKQYLNALYEIADHLEITIVGLCKTNSLLTNSGKAVSAVLDKLKKGAWYYHPVALIDSDDFKADIFMCKLHNKGKHVFRVDVHGKDFKGLFAELMVNSSDPVFLGYPYGLVEADKQARISNKDKEYLRTKLMVELGSEWEKIKSLETTKDAHGILDSIG